MIKIHWLIRVLPYLLIGVFTLFIGIFELFGLLNENEPVSYRIKNSIIFFIISLICFFPVYETINKNIFGKKTWVDIAKDVVNIQISLLLRDEQKLKLARIKSIIFASIFSLFIFTPIFFPRLINIKPIFSFSLMSISLIWFICYPALVSAMWNLPKKAFNEDHRKMLQTVRFFLPALVSAYLFLYLEILGHYNNKVEIEFEVNIISLSNSDTSCNRRVSVHDKTGAMFGFCTDNIRNNLVNGNVAYIDDNVAVLRGRIGWVGTVVDSVIWHQQYTINDRIWSIEKQKYIYR